ncbi:MAG TPA: phosphatase PAP2 family protein [Gemmatimonadaceae bacterium]|nr:phosphatase PAP2 family protein [Gemmatimonadaceae bacterium]
MHSANNERVLEHEPSLARAVHMATLLAILAWSNIFAQAPPAQATDTDTVATQSSAMVTRRGIAFAGAAVVATGLLAPFDHPIQRTMQAEDLQDNKALHRTASAFGFSGGPGPFIAAGALYLFGRATSSQRFASLGVHLTEGIVLAAGLNGIVKGVSGRALPNAKSGEPGDFSFGRGFHDGNGSFVSFPSGHTAASFAAAAVLTDEVSSCDCSATRIVGPLAYSTATLVALSRLYQNVHWASDLPLGAAIGVLSGKTVVSWQRRHPGNWLDRYLAGVTLVPDGHRIRVATTVPVGSNPH